MKELLDGQDVILFGGSEKYTIPILHAPFIVRVNNHHIWQENPKKCPGGYAKTDCVYHGAGIGGIQAMFMNNPPKGLQLLCQNAGGAYRDSMRAWATLKGVEYFAYANEEAPRHAVGLDPAVYEEEFKPLIDVCTHPFTGVLAAFHLLQFPIRSLYLSGFTFYAGRNSTIKNGKRGEHDIEQNKQAMRNVLKDERAKPDGILLQSLR